MKSLPDYERENAVAVAKARAERLGLNAMCPACKAAPGEGCRGDDGAPQSAYTHNARLGR